MCIRDRPLRPQRGLTSSYVVQDFVHQQLCHMIFSSHVFSMDQATKFSEIKVAIGQRFRIWLLVVNALQHMFVSEAHHHNPSRSTYCILWRMRSGQLTIILSALMLSVRRPGRCLSLSLSLYLFISHCLHPWCVCSGLLAPLRRWHVETANLKDWAHAWHVKAS